MLRKLAARIDARGVVRLIHAEIDTASFPPPRPANLSPSLQDPQTGAVAGALRDVPRVRLRGRFAGASSPLGR
jgi:hypothetical protein